MYAGVPGVERSEGVQGTMRAVGYLKRKVLGVLGVAVLLSGCGSSEKGDNPTRGTLAVAADESFYPVVNAVTKGYEGIYPDTHFEVAYKPEQEAILSFLQDSVRLIFVTRELTDKEKAVLEKKNGNYRAQHIATDGIALITSKSNPDSTITTAQLKEIFAGKITNWSQLNGKQQAITLVFDDVNSSNLRYMMDKFNFKDLSGLRLHTAQSNEAVIDYVRRDPTAIGFIGVNWISDGDEAITHKLSQGIRVFGVSDKENPTSIKEYHQPFQTDLRNGTYPLSRKLFILSNDGNSSLGGGLKTYIARDVGGLIIQKTGLVPTVPYPRVIEVRNEQNF
jgi:phosphate transport system substrate-binding protein